MADDFKLTPPGDEVVIDRSYYVAAFMDEVPPHRPTLEAAATFLLKGGESQEDFAEQAKPTGPLAADGDIIELDVLDLYADRTAIRADDGTWSLEPPPPRGAHFFAIRFAPGYGWSADEILSDNPTDDELAAAADGDDIIQNIATGITRTEYRRFRVTGDTATLEPLTPEEEAAHTAKADA